MSDPIRFHLSLNVSDLSRSVAFFRSLFGTEPAKIRSDYAKFETGEPPLVLSLEPAHEVKQGGALNHLGFRLPDSKSLVAMQSRLEQAGFRTKREEGVECCYARQTKFWLHDPDGNMWEVYTLEGDIEHRGVGQARETILTVQNGTSEPRESVVWEHRMGEPVPARIPLANGSADEIRLRGTLNLPLSKEQQRELISDAVRALKPGGRLFVHVLAGESQVENPELPGPAGGVRQVPCDADPVALLEDAGLVRARMLKFDSRPCFVRNGVGMRELQLEGYTAGAPVESQEEPKVTVLYRGPFQEVRDDQGRAYPRGRRVDVPASVANSLQAGELAGQFTVFPSSHTPQTVGAACGN